MLTQANLTDVLSSLGFIKKGHSYSKTLGAATLEVNMAQASISYPEAAGLVVNERQTCNFEASENFVVLECVHRLLEKGYKPEHIELEPKWKLGRGASGGRADILVKDNAGRPLLIIECKTAGSEFKRAWNKTLQDGDQLFSYAQQISETQFLCLYTADFEAGALTYTSHIIAHRDNEKYLASDSSLKGFQSATDVKERYAVWRDTYKLDHTTKGIFEENIQPFHIGKDKYSLADLKAISARDQQKKYHEFATILRQHNVSGRENAFDKLVNLFLCKLVDEIENPNDLKFYWKGVAYDTHFELMDRLQQLYQAGMGKFLGEDITYINQGDVHNALRFIRQNPDATQRAVWKLFVQQKFFTNNDFSLIDVHNEKLFYQNAEVLLKILQMWQDIRLTKTDGHNQFLGDMFEGFLDQGVKQSEGQFFTPMPICRFILQSLPLDAMVQASATPPKAIDYACGAGHFLTELALQLQPLVQAHQPSAHMGDYHAAIYGIEKEYRLSKVAKVSAFMYGQQGINICYGDGLRAQHAAFPAIANNSFDLLIANPPYSVKGFLTTLPEEERQAYRLSETVGDLDTAGSIETFFIERAQQLLRADGVAAIILPSSVLSNGGSIYVRTREILLAYFDIIAIAELGSGTFGKTGTNTVTLFLRRKQTAPDTAAHYRERVDDWFKGASADTDAEKIYQDQHLLAAYAAHIGVPLADYQAMLSGQASAQWEQHAHFEPYLDKFNASPELSKLEKSPAFKKLSPAEQEAEIHRLYLKLLHPIERDKLYHFVMASGQRQRVLIIRSPSDNKEQKKFLGYEWSSAKGDEGIKLSKDAQGRHLTPLYDEANRHNADKINSLIAANFQGQLGEIPPALQSFAHTASLVEMLDFSRFAFEKQLHLTPKKAAFIQSTRYPMERLSNLAAMLRRGKASKYGDGETQIIKSGQARGGLDFDFSEKHFVEEGFITDERQLQLGDLLINSTGKGTAGRVTLFELVGKFVADSHITILRPNAKLLPRFGLYSLERMGFKTIEALAQGASGQIELTLETIGQIQIPLPPLPIQQQIVAECEAVDTDVQTAEDRKQQLRSQVATLFHNLRAPMQKLGSVTSKIGSGATPKGGESAYKETGIALIRSQNIYDDHFKEKGLAFIDDEQARLLNSVTVEPHDVLLNITGASVARCFVIDPRYLPARVNQHVAIIRPCADLLPKYLHQILINPDYKAQLLALAAGSLSREAITKGQIEEFKIPVPDLSIQTKLVAQVEALEKQIAQAQAVIDGAAARKQAILQKHL